MMLDNMPMKHTLLLVFAVSSCGGTQSQDNAAPEPVSVEPSTAEAASEPASSEPASEFVDPFAPGARADIRFDPTLREDMGYLHVQFGGTEPLARLDGKKSTVHAVLRAADNTVVRSNAVPLTGDDRSGVGLLLHDNWRFQFETPVPVGRYKFHIESVHGNLKTRPEPFFVVPARGCVANEQAEARCKQRGADFKYGPMMSYYCGGAAPRIRPDAALDVCMCNSLPQYHEQRIRCQRQGPKP